MPGVTLAEATEAFIPALAIWREMRSESDLARLAVYWVIHNRASDGRARWPKSTAAVVLQKYQFASFTPGDPNSSHMPRPDSHGADYAAWLEICAMCDAPGPDPTGGANAYENLPDAAAKPGWVSSARPVKIIGKTRFYRL